MDGNLTLAGQQSGDVAAEVLVAPPEDLTPRQRFCECLNRVLASGDGQAAVLIAGLDRFRAVNERFGHLTGDAVLRTVEQRMRTLAPPGGVTAHLGSDEFAMAISAPGAADTVGARLLDLLSRPYLAAGNAVIVTASIGIATGPRDGQDGAALIRAADLALHRAKDEGLRTIQVFDPRMDIHARASHALADDLRRALALQQLELHYQPQVALAGGQLVGFEALLRWRHPQLGLVPPDQFISLAEDLDLIVPMGEWVLRTACHEAATWPGDISVAVNVSAKQLADRERLPRAVAAALAATGLRSGQLDIEITESGLMRSKAEALHVMHALGALGVRISMDDFGTGYSSLGQLRSFPFSKLKIDRAFVRDLPGSQEATAVILAIAALGTGLGMTTVAEGVETQEQKAAVQAHGCTQIQGYLLSRPVPAKDVPALITRLRAPPHL